MPRGLLFGDVEDVPQPVIVLRPVHEGDVAIVGAGREISPPRDSAIEPPAAGGSLLVALRIEWQLALDERAWIGRNPTEQLAGPRRFQPGRIVAPEGVLLRL